MLFQIILIKNENNIARYLVDFHSETDPLLLLGDCIYEKK